MYGCDPHTLKGVDYVGKVMERAAKESKTKVVEIFFHQFLPYGVSGVVVIEESHYTIHTWPEERYAAIDLFYCDPKVDVDRAIEVLKESFKPQHVTIMEVKRGVLPEVHSFVKQHQEEMVS
ncbi:MAG: adenosylmethionine decarboxylase [Candidatus Aminicenantes bacterium]|nr:adenosylmethionine decarboxylase [Candidatus Aminicenantes bacterium]